MISYIKPHLCVPCPSSSQHSTRKRPWELRPGPRSKVAIVVASERPRNRRRNSGRTVGTPTEARRGLRSGVASWLHYQPALASPLAAYRASVSISRLFGDRQRKPDENCTPAHHQSSECNTVEVSKLDGERPHLAWVLRDLTYNA